MSNESLRDAKTRRQQQFLESCRERGLTPMEALREASFIPPDLKPGDIKVVKWPRYR